MKNLLFPLFAFAIAMVSCEKSQSGGKNSTGFYSIPAGSVFENLAHSSDAEDLHINEMLYELTRGLKSMNCTQPVELVPTITAFDESNEIPLYRLLSDIGKESEFDAWIHANTSFSGLADLTNSLSCGGVDYHPQVYFPNREVIEAEFGSDFGVKSDFVIGVGESISQNDEIPGWKYENGKWGTTLCGENLLLPLKIPVFILTIGTNYVEVAQATSGAFSSGGAAGNDIWYEAQWDEYRVKDGYRYEQNGKSDLYFMFTHYWPTLPYYSNSLENNTVESQRYEALIDRVKEMDVQNSTLFTGDKYLTLQPQLETDAAGNQFYVSVFERDWYAGVKTVQSCLSSDLQHKVRMKYSHEWYYVDYCGFGFQGSVVGDSFTVDNAKCTLTIKRTL